MAIPHVASDRLVLRTARSRIRFVRWRPQAIEFADWVCSRCRWSFRRRPAAPSSDNAVIVPLVRQHRAASVPRAQRTRRPGAPFVGAGDRPQPAGQRRSATANRGYGRTSSALPGRCLRLAASGKSAWSVNRDKGRLVRRGTASFWVWPGGRRRPRTSWRPTSWPA